MRVHLGELGGLRRRRGRRVQDEHLVSKWREGGRERGSFVIAVVIFTHLDI